MGQNEPSKHVCCGGSFSRKRPWRPRSKERAGAIEREETDENSPASISAFDRGCCCASGGVAYREGASLSNAPCGLSRGRRARHHRSVVRASWSAGGRREPAGCRLEYRHGSSHKGSPGRMSATPISEEARGERISTLAMEIQWRGWSPASIPRRRMMKSWR
jgi:hypothetical protein